MKLLEFDHWKFTRELWGYYQQHISQINHQTLVSLRQQGFFIEIPLSDPRTFTALQGEQVESLLFESELSRWLIAQMQPNSLQDLMVIVTFLRSPYFYTHYSAFQILVERKSKQNHRLPKWSDAICTILQPTYGLPLYIEQIAEILVILTGYPLENTYSLLQRLERRQVDFNQDVEEFLEAARKHGEEREIAWRLFALLVEFAPDAVSRSSLESYVKPAYESAYLQTHHGETYLSVKEELKHAKTKLGA